MKWMNIVSYTALLIGLTACVSSSPATPADLGDEPLSSSSRLATQTAGPGMETGPGPTGTSTGIVDPITEMPPSPTAGMDEITFIKTFGGNRRDRGIHLLQTRDGGYAIVGYTSSLDAIQEDVYLVRTDPEGNLLWDHTYGGDGIDNGWEIVELEDGGFLIVGFTDSFGAGGMDIYLIRTDMEGELLWDRTFGGPEDEFGWAMAADPDGGYVLAGQTTSFGEGEEDGYLVKVNAQGEEIWSQTYGGPREDRLFSVDQGSDGGFILTGTTRSFDAGERDLYLVKTDPSGELAWTQVLGEDRDDVGHTVRQIADGGYIVTGYTRSFGAANYDTWLIKTDAAGDTQWQEFFGGPRDDRTIYGEQTDDGGYILIGYTTGFESAGLDVFLVRTDPAGKVLWYKTYGGTTDDTGYTVRQTSDRGFILTGETYSSGAGGGDMYLIKVDQEGNTRAGEAPP